MIALTNQEVTQLRKILHKVKQGVAKALLPEIDRKIAQNYEGPVVGLSVMAGQNFFTSVIMAVWDDLGFNEPYEVAELAARIAAYMVTATPVEEHAKWVQAIQEALPTTVAAKVMNDHGLPVGWADGGKVRPAIPGAGYDR